MNNAPREITARPFNPEVHGQFHQVRNSYGDVVDETRFSFWPEIAGDSDGVYTPLEGTQHKTSECLKDRHPHIAEAQHFTSKVHPHEVASAFGQRTIPKFASLLALDGLPADKRLLSLTSVYDLLTSQESKAEAIDCDVVKTCVGLLSDKSAGVREYAARVLAACVALLPGRRNINASGGLPKLTELLADEEVRVREAASLALMSVSDFRNGARDLIDSQEDAVLYLVNAMFDTEARGTSGQSSVVVYHVVATLANLTSLLAGVAVDRALSSGAVTKLVKLLEPDNPISSPKLQVKVLNALWNLSLQDQAKTPIIEAGGIPLIVEALNAALGQGDKTRGVDETDERIRRYGSGALLSLSVDEVCKVQLQENLAIDTISHLLYDKAPPTRKNAVSVVHHVAESPRGLTLFTRKLVPDNLLLVEVFSERAAAALTELLTSDASDVRQHAAGALALLTSEDPPGDPLGPGQPVGNRKVGKDQGVLQCLYVVERLIGLLTDSNPATQRSAQTALHHLALRSPKAYDKLYQAVIEDNLAVDFGDLFEEAKQ
jgi:HEAT repeat protein